MRKRIVFHGPLKHLEPIEVVATTPAEAIEAVTRQLPEFRGSPHFGRYRLKVAGINSLEDLHKPTEIEEFHVVPQLNGGKGGFVQVLVGAALVAASFAIPGSTLAFGAFTLQGFTMAVGASLFLGGVAQLLAPQPELAGKTEDNPANSLYLGSDQNTVAIGTPIPILYGKYRVYGHFLSFDVSASDVGV